jgi:aquaporin Z
VTNTSVNPARSTGPALALLAGGQGQALGQLWLFWVAPIIGAVIGAIAYKSVGGKDAA